MRVKGSLKVFLLHFAETLLAQGLTLREAERGSRSGEVEEAVELIEGNDVDK